MEHRFHVSSATWINLSMPFFEGQLAQQSNSAHPGSEEPNAYPTVWGFWDRPALGPIQFTAKVNGRKSQGLH